jgi:hypothetical protein
VDAERPKELSADVALNPIRGYYSSPERWQLLCDIDPLFAACVMSARARLAADRLLVYRRAAACACAVGV